MKRSTPKMRTKSDLATYAADLEVEIAYLERDKAELRERLDRGPSEFSVRIQIADAWDDTSDPTVAWPRHRLRILMGTLKLTGVADDQDRFCEDMSFNPGRLLPGMGLSDDPVLPARLAVYAASQERRGVAVCPVTSS